MKLRIVAINDVYSLENLPRLATLIERERCVDPADSLLVTVAGDFLSPSLLSSLDAGRGMVDCMNALGVTHASLGNHEDDLAPEELLARLGELSATVLATNVRGLSSSLTSSDVIEVGGVRVGMLGVVMTDPSVYRRAPFGGNDVRSPIPSALAEAQRLIGREECAFVVPLTHQFVHDDRALARAQRDAGAPFPVILGGHEHQPVRADEGGTWIVKAGSDAANAVVVDLELDLDGDVDVRVRLEPVSAHEEDPALRARVDAHMARVRELETATLLSLEPGAELSSIGTRSRQTSLGALLCRRIRDCVGAELCLFNGGGIRASRAYEGRFTYGDLRREVPFDNEIVVARIPGRVVRDAVAASRAHAPAEHGGFLQVDDAVTVDATGLVVTHVRGEALDPARDYRVALVRNLFFGLDGIEPLVRFATESPDRVPDEGSGRDVRVVLVDAFSVALWKQLGGFDAVDTNHDERVSAADVADALVRITRSASAVTADLIVHALDTNGDKLISREEAAAVDSQASTERGS
jgi:2',3'-cyclic-nucleotide 2'-phosphodiesterase (5'-nucleotidase family)